MKTDSHHNKTLRLKPHYIFGTVALATLLALLAAMHPRGNQFIAESLVTIESDVALAGDLAARDQLLRSKCISPEAVEAVLSAIPPAIVKDAGFDRIAIDELSQLISSKLVVQIERPPGSTTETIYVRYASQSQPFAMRLVAAVSEHVAENYTEQETNPQFISDLASADERIQSLKNQLTDLRNAQDRMLQDGVAAWRRAGPTSDDLEPEPLGNPNGGAERGRPPAVSRDGEPFSNAAEEVAGDALGSDQLGQDNAEVDGRDFESDELDPNEFAADEFAEQPTATDATVDEAPFPEMFANSAEQNGSNQPHGDEPVQHELPTWNPPGDARPQAADEPAAASPVVTSQPVTQPQRPTVSGQSPSLPKVYQLNPRWSAVSNALSRARLELERSLKMMTAEHPSIVELKAQIKDLERILAKTPQHLPADEVQPQPTLTPIPVFQPQSDRQSSIEPATGGVRFESAGDEIQTVSFTEAEARQRITNSAEFQALSTQIRQVKTELARTINDRNALAAAPPQRKVRVSGDAKLFDSQCPSVSPFDLLTLFLPAAVLALVAAIARKPAEAPSVLCSVSDARKALRSTVIGSISTKNGPGIPAAELGGPPTIVSWMVGGSEVICVAAAVLVLISILQIPGYTKQFFTNPFSAFVTSFDFVVQFIRHT